MKLIKLLTVMIIASSVLFINTVYAKTKWDMPTPYSDGVHHTKNVRQFANDVARATNGELNIVVHSGASLIKHTGISKAVRTGQVQIGEIFMGLLGNENALFKADNIPFLASDFASARKLWSISKPKIERYLQSKGLKLLYAVPWPPQGLYTKKAIHFIEDIKGLKLRAYSPSTSRLAVLLKTVPTTVQTPEIPQAFSTNIINAMITSPSTGVSSQSWDYISHYNDVQAWIPKNMVVVNVRAFKRLNNKTQNAVVDMAAIAEVRGWDIAMKETSSKTNILAKNGISVSQPSKALKRSLREIGRIMADEWASESGKNGEDILYGLE